MADDLELLQLQQQQLRIRRERANAPAEPPPGVYLDETTGQMVDPALQAERQRMEDENILRQRPVASRAVEMAQGLPLVGEWLDEGVEKISPRAAQNMRSMSDAMERQRPGQATALNIAGGMLAAAPLAQGAVGALKGGNAIARGLKAGIAAAPAGAIEGAASFAGRAAPGERLEAARTGALVGGTLAVALGPVASLTGDGVSAMARRIKALDVKAIIEEFGVSRTTARVIRSALQNDDLDAAAKQLAVLGDDAMLADAGQATGALLDASAQTGGKALRVAREAADGRSAEMGRRLTGTLDMLLGKPRGIKTAAEDISRGTAQARKMAYDAAYGQAIDYADNSGMAIEAVLDRIPPKTLQSAIQEANEAMTEAGVKNMQIMAQIADDGAVRFVEMPNVQQLDFIKRALDETARGSKDQWGRFTAAGLRARRLAADLRDALRTAVPEYGKAVRLGGDKIQMDEALDLGRTLLFKGTTVEDVRRFMKHGVSQEAKDQIRQGMRESIENNLSNVRRTITDANVDAREAMQLVKEMSSRANITKVRMVLGPERADRLLKELDKTAAALELRAAIAGNSKTAIRQAIQGQVVDETAPSLLRRTIGKGGNPLDAAREVTEMVAGIDPRTLTGEQKAIFDEIAQVLTTIRGPEAQKALTAVRRAMAGQPIRDQDAALIGQIVGGNLGLGLYQSGEQYLTPR